MTRKFFALALLTVFVLVPASAAAQTAEKNIVETAVAAGSFTTLATALEAADLLGVLQGDGPFTVFAPTDAAFAKLPAGTVQALLAAGARAPPSLFSLPGSATAALDRLDLAR